MEADKDGDSWTVPGDCDDQNAAINPDADEVCDGIDNDCDDGVDEDDASDATSWYADQDGDGYAGQAEITFACNAPDDFYATADDCDDAEGSVHPGATEVCDGVDQDCDDEVDEDFDTDGDGHLSQARCGSDLGSDCDDEDADSYPGADELCDGLDNDCDLDIDEEPTDADTWYEDYDQDGWGADDSSVVACEQPSGFVHENAAGDCNDNNAYHYPGAAESCDGADQDCDDEVDEDFDLDGDGYPAGETCEEVDDLELDCDDDDDQVNPGMGEICDNGIDDNCDGAASSSCGL